MISETLNLERSIIFELKYESKVHRYRLTSFSIRLTFSQQGPVAISRRDSIMFYADLFVGFTSH